MAAYNPWGYQGYHTPPPAPFGGGLHAGVQVPQAVLQQSVSAQASAVALQPAAAQQQITPQAQAVSQPPVVAERPATIKDLCKSTNSAPEYRGFLKVTVGEGDQAQTFEVHEALLTARSEFFKRAMSGNWVEARQGLVKLPDDDPATFKRYVHLLYTNTLAVRPDPLPPNYKGQEERSALAKLYVLAEKLQDDAAKTTILEAMLLSCQSKDYSSLWHVPNFHAVTRIYAGTPPDSPMRKLLVDLFAHRAKSTWFSKKDAHWPSDFTQELAAHLLATRVVPDLTMTGDASRYLKVKEEPKS